MTATLVTAGAAQRRFAAPPGTGVITTPSGGDPLWQPLTAYAVDPTDGAINRVVNGGGLYQCRTDGISGLVGPTGSDADIEDGTAHWQFLGIAPSPNNALAGDLILVTSGRGMEAVASPAAPTDSAGSTYAVIELHAYAAAPDAYAGAYRTAAGAAVSNFRSSLAWGDIGGGSGDQVTNTFTVFRGVVAGAPHAQSHVERATATAGIVAGAPIVIAAPCLVVTWMFSNGAMLEPGESHTAIPQGALAGVPANNCLMSLSTNGYAPQHTSWYVESTPGSVTARWRTNGDGGHVITAAWLLSAPAAEGGGGTGAVVGGAIGASIGAVVR